MKNVIENDLKIEIFEKEQGKFLRNSFNIKCDKIIVYKNAGIIFYLKDVEILKILDIIIEPICTFKKTLKIEFRENYIDRHNTLFIYFEEEKADETDVLNVGDKVIFTPSKLFVKEISPNEKNNSEKEVSIFEMLSYMVVVVLKNNEEGEDTKKNIEKYFDSLHYVIKEKVNEDLYLIEHNFDEDFLKKENISINTITKKSYATKKQLKVKQYFIDGLNAIYALK